MTCARVDSLIALARGRLRSNVERSCWLIRRQGCGWVGSVVTPYAGCIHVMCGVAIGLLDFVV